MTTNMYDVAVALQKELAKDEVFLLLKEKYYAILEDEKSKQLFGEFRDNQMMIKQKMALGQEVTEEEKEEAEKIHQEVQNNEKIVELMKIEQQMNMVIAELNKIIIQPLGELYATF